MAVACDREPAPGPGGGTEPWALGRDPFVTIGSVEGDPDQVFSRIADVRLFADGRVAVADGASASVRVYDADGRLLRRLGRPGEGPGEFVALSSIALLDPDTVLAFDPRAGRLTRFLTDGSVAATVTFRAPEGYPEIYVGSATDGAHVVAWIRQEPPGRSAPSVDRMRMGRFTPGGDSLVTVVDDVGMRRVGSPVPLSPHFLSAMVGDSVFHTDGVGGEVRVTGMDGAAVRSFTVPLVPPDPEEALRQLRATLDSAARGRLDALAPTPAMDTVPAFSEMLADPEGRLWLKAYEPTTDSHWLLRRRTGGAWIVVTTDGRFVARVVMPDGFRPFDVRDDRIAGVSRDELDIERVSVYPIVRSGARDEGR